MNEAAYGLVVLGGSSSVNAASVKDEQLSNADKIHHAQDTLKRASGIRAAVIMVINIQL